MPNHINAWPELNYLQFKPTAHLLHMGLQAIGKFKLHNPFEPHWANVALWLTARGLTTGLIKSSLGGFCIDVDLLQHQVIVTTTWGLSDSFIIEAMSVATFTQQLFHILKKCKIELEINLIPQEIPNPIAFDQDTEIRAYDKDLVHRWWSILLSTYWVMKRYHSFFDGETPPIGLMWGTFDIRDARYNGISVPVTGVNAGYIRRNAMNEAQVEVGWWPGSEAYLKPAYYSFVYPQPDKIEQAIIQPAKARWDASMMEFVLDYDDLRTSAHPEEDLLAFFESTYRVGASLAGWDAKFLTKGEPEQVF